MKTQYACQYNENVLCSRDRRCARCGWNPEVAQARKEKSRDGKGERHGQKTNTAV